MGDEIIAVDGTTIRANNNSYKNFNLKKVSNKIKEIEEKIQQYFDAMDTEDHKEDIEKLNQSRAKYESLMKQLEEKQISSLSLTDCDASLVCDKKGGLMPGYNVQSAVDSQNDIVVEIDTNQNVVDWGQLSVMVEKIQKNSIKKDFIVIADCGYWKGEDLAKTEHLGVIPLIGVPKNPQRHDQPEPYKTNKFRYDRKNDKYICPEGKYLFCHQIRGKGFKRYFNREACFNCLCKSECCKLNKLGFKTINRSNYADAIDRNTERIKNNKKLYHRRWELAEHPFGTIKRTLNGGYYLLRGLQKVSTETALMFLGYNIRRVFNVIGFTKIMAKLEAI